MQLHQFNKLLALHIFYDYYFKNFALLTFVAKIINILTTQVAKKYTANTAIFRFQPFVTIYHRL